MGCRRQGFLRPAKFADKFDSKLYGIEPGSNQLMLDAVNDPALGLHNWEVVESSEQGMLSQVTRFARNKSFIVFEGLGAAPDEQQIRHQVSDGRR